MTRYRPATPAFTLIEMLAVIAIIAIVTAFIVPAASQMMRGNQLTQAANMVTDQISLARQQAVTQNAMIEVRFIRFADPEQPGETVADPATGKFRALQIMQVYNSGSSVPVGLLQVLPTTVVFNNQPATMQGTAPAASNSFSTLIPSTQTGSNDPTLPAYGKPGQSDPDMPHNIKKNYDYYSFRFLPDGSTSLQPVFSWFLTLNKAADLQKIGSDASSFSHINFFTLQLDPTSGATRAYRANAQ